MSKNKSGNGHFVCPNCGTDLVENAKVCPNCGSDESTGWSESTYLDGLGIPFEDEYDEIKESEFSSKRRRQISWSAAVGIILLILFVVMVLRF
ncbi:MAG: zinc-ribbon domain-containing protein [Fibrobacter sp.]|nr:zinc-ribbon domain-containing protein [Fibrobacter sp.]